MKSIYVSLAFVALAGNAHASDIKIYNKKAADPAQISAHVPSKSGANHSLRQSGKIKLIHDHKTGPSTLHHRRKKSLRESEMEKGDEHKTKKSLKHGRTKF